MAAHPAHQRATGRRLSAALATGVTALVLASCGSSSHHQTGDIFTGVTSTNAAANTGGTTSTPSGETITTTSSTAAASIPGLRTIANAVQTQPGTRLEDRFQMGPIGYSSDISAASQAIASCPAAETADPQSNAYAEGQVTFRYVKGTLPLQVTFSLDGILSDTRVATGQVTPDGGIKGDMAFQQSDGSWTCGGIDQTDEISLSFQPGAVATNQFWIVLTGALTNASPTLSRRQQNSIILRPLVQVGDSNAVFKPFGPAVYQCSFGNPILPFAHGAVAETLNGGCRHGG